MYTEKEFILSDFIAEKTGKSEKVTVIDFHKDKTTRFFDICSAVKTHFEKEWDLDPTKKEQYEVLLERQKRAIIGYPTEVNFYQAKIMEYLETHNLQTEWFPSWYSSFSEAIFAETWGFSSLTAWLNGHSKNYRESSSAKIIGNRIYFMIGGKLVLQEQTISKERRVQLRKALLLKTPKARLNEDYHEVYTLDGTRITILGEGKTKTDQDVFVFRKFHVKDYSFDKQIEMGTIPSDSKELFEIMAKMGFNVAFTGAVRTAKTTFLTTWQNYEKPDLEGIIIETDPEIPLHEIMPTAPIIQIVADGEELEKVVKSILRADPDYVIMAEARDATAFQIALEVTDRGTRRSKMTCHFSNALDFPYNIAKIIAEKQKGDLYTTISKVAQNFNYVFEFIQLPDKSKKRLKGIYELEFDSMEQEIVLTQLCRYIHKTDSWEWNYSFKSNAKRIAEEESPELINLFEIQLRELAERYPMQQNAEFRPNYLRLRT